MVNMTEMSVKNMVMSVQLNKDILLHSIPSSNCMIQYESEIFPAALITKWKPVLIAVFHNGKVILTGVKSLLHAQLITGLLIDYLSSHFVAQ